MAFPDDLFRDGEAIADTKAPEGPIEERWGKRKFGANPISPHRTGSTPRSFLRERIRTMNHFSVYRMDSPTSSEQVQQHLMLRPSLPW